MFYLSSSASKTKMPSSLPTWHPEQVLFLDQVVQKKVGHEWLLISPTTGAWCFVTGQELEICKQLNEVALSDMESKNYIDASKLHDLLGQLYLRGLLHIREQNATLCANWRVNPSTITPKSISLTLLLSDHCNLACKYCYLSQIPREHPRKMSLEVAVEALEFAFEQEANRIIIDFGEITLNYDLFRELVGEVHKLSTRFSAKEVNIAIQTNGTNLRPTVIDFLENNSITVGISLDGPSLVHNKTRVFGDGRGSYHQTIDGLKNILHRNIPHIVSCTVSQANLLHAGEILDHFLDLGVKFHAFKPIIRRGQAKNTWNVLGISPEEYCMFLDDVLSYALSNENIDALDDNYVKFVFRALGDERGWTSMCPTSYCDCGEDMYVVNSRGIIYPCPRFSSNDQDLFQLGNSWRQGIERRNDFVGVINTRAINPPKRCHQCEWLALCHGGCSLAAWYEDISNPYGEDPNCVVYSHLYDLIFGQIFPALRAKERFSSTKIGRLEIFDQIIL